jgi:hypothetical protein
LWKQEIRTDESKKDENITEKIKKEKPHLKSHETMRKKLRIFWNVLPCS